MFNKDKKRILILLTFLVLALLSLILYLSYFIIFRAEDIANHPANRRATIEENQIKRGSIYDREGDLLAYSEGEPGSYHRVYTFPTIYSHIIGYNSNSLGNSGLESSYNDYLLNRNGNRTLKEITDFLRDKNQDGNSLHLTIDTKVQSKARELLDSNGKKGSIVLLNPKTGEIYGMVSLPDFNSQNIERDWNTIQESQEGTLLNRSINGRYPPGSTFKIITEAAILENGIDTSYEDKGVETIDGRDFKNAFSTPGGQIGLTEAFMHSYNTYFTRKGIELGKDKLGNMSDQFMFNKKIPFDLPVTTSTFNYKQSLAQTTLAASAIGQGDVLATPLNMALVSAAIANDGKMMRPYLVDTIKDQKGNIILDHNPKILKQSVSPEIAHQIQDDMVQVVRQGSGSNASIRGIQVAGKTGTAENSTGKNHAWFVGFAPADDPQLAIAVILEQSGEYGSTAAAPIARDLLIFALNNIDFTKSQLSTGETDEE